MRTTKVKLPCIFCPAIRKMRLFRSTLRLLLVIHQRTVRTFTRDTRLINLTFLGSVTSAVSMATSYILVSLSSYPVCRTKTEDVRAHTKQEIKHNYLNIRHSKLWKSQNVCKN